MGLARTMTLKASAAGLDLGGGKAVMIDDGDDSLRLERLEAAAGVIEGLGGAYITAEDIGTTTADIDHMARFTSFCTGRSVANGGGGDPSPVTAETVLAAMRRAPGGPDRLRRARRAPGRRDRARQGRRRAGRAARRGGRARGGLRSRRLALRALRGRARRGRRPAAEAILGMQLDVLAPCAGGGLIDDALARSLDVGVVAGAANNPLTARGVAAHPDGARHPLRAGLPRQLRRA